MKKKSLVNAVCVIISIFMLIGFISIFVGVSLADSGSFVPTLLLTGGGCASVGLCYLFGKAVFDSDFAE